MDSFTDQHLRQSVSGVPLPRPPLLVAPTAGAYAVDLVTAATDHGWGWSARAYPTGEITTRIHTRKSHTGVVDRMASEIADWIREFHPGQPVTVRCFTQIIRESLVSRVPSELVALPAGLALGPGTSWAQVARHDLMNQLDHQEDDLRSKRVLYGATDGSLHPVYGNGAWSWVDQHGNFDVGRAPRDILLAELTGIVRFAKQVRTNVFGRAVLFVDSMPAIRAFKSQSANLWRLRDQEGMMQTVSMIQGNRLELIWVRSHRGQPLNDVADRLALMRHRAVRMNLSEQEIQSAGRNIVAQEQETLLSTNWSKARMSAVREYQIQIKGRHGGRKV